MKDPGDIELAISKIEMISSKARVAEPSELASQMDANRAQLSDRMLGMTVALCLVAAGALLLGGYRFAAALVVFGSFAFPTVVFALRQRRLKKIREMQLRQTRILPSTSPGFERN